MFPTQVYLVVTSSPRKTESDPEYAQLIGSANRFPGGLDSTSKLWEFLKKPTADLQSKVPKERFDIDAFYHPDGSVRGCTNTRYGYFLRENLNEFDASFFNIQAGEAEGMDPQQRLLLETTFEAVASAGLRVEDLRGSRTAVFVGLMTHDVSLSAPPPDLTAGLVSC